jgi:hypothetical protein
MAKNAKDIPQPPKKQYVKKTVNDGSSSPIVAKKGANDRDFDSCSSDDAIDVQKDFDIRRYEAHKKRGRKKFGKRMDKAMEGNGVKVGELERDCDTGSTGTGEESPARVDV